MEAVGPTEEGNEGSSGDRGMGNMPVQPEQIKTFLQEICESPEFQALLQDLPAGEAMAVGAEWVSLMQDKANGNEVTIGQFVDVAKKGVKVLPKLLGYLARLDSGVEVVELPKVAMTIMRHTPALMRRIKDVADRRLGDEEMVESAGKLNALLAPHPVKEESQAEYLAFIEKREEQEQAKAAGQ